MLMEKKNKKLQEQYNSLSDIDKLVIRKEFERIDLMTFSKLISINEYHITLNFFPIKEAEKIDKLNSDEIREEDEDYTFEHHISLKNVKKEIECYLFKPPKNSIATQENLFLFIYKIFHLLKYYKFITIN